ncbi:hypothetical protein MUY27_00385 [Mucilaginibacter sp. RS28]|uniref:DNA polymerase Y-family little finger domain-containing protein n=1 Tax=Mucilaginibacter straminoryzae TaxID=2932774 RepID=A0A9X2B7B6_9SPHI|nr:hypothetical protein [Mucilaginibacter straminoryzae]MCJ8208141.1 hypothetical protein [Mucilaginibacter straminoryzae]
MPIGDEITIAETAKQLLTATNLTDVRIRLLGITLSNFNIADKDEGTDQLRLF